MRTASSLITAVSQYFEAQVYDVFAIRGNAAIFKCQVPSFVADYVEVAGWIDSNDGRYSTEEELYGTRNRSFKKMFRPVLCSPYFWTHFVNSYFKLGPVVWLQLLGSNMQ